MEATIQDVQQEIVDEFSAFDDWMDKYEYLIELGKSLPVIDEKNKQEDRLIKGCQSRVWLNTELRDGRLFFTADSDAIITKGIISLLIRVYNGRTPEEILAADKHLPAMSCGLSGRCTIRRYRSTSTTSALSTTSQ